MLQAFSSSEPLNLARLKVGHWGVYGEADMTVSAVNIVQYFNISGFLQK